MRDGWYVGAGGIKVTQDMHQADGTFKGVKQILDERGLDGSGLRAKCDRKSRKRRGKADPSRCDPGERCCALNVLSNQRDFLGQKTALEELCARHGHIARMLPKCHPELNAIESVWAWLKTYLRRVCDYTFTALKKNAPAAADSLSLAAVRRYFRRQHRFCSLYFFEATQGQPLPFKIREYVMKKYSRHRVIPDGVLAAVDASLVEREAKLAQQAVKNPTARCRSSLAATQEMAEQLRNYKPTCVAAKPSGAEPGAESDVCSGGQSSGGDEPLSTLSVGAALGHSDDEAILEMLESSDTGSEGGSDGDDDASDSELDDPGGAVVPGDGLAFEPTEPYDLAGPRHHRAPLHREPGCGDYVASPFPGAGWFVGCIAKIDQKTLAAVAAGRAIAQPWPFMIGWEDGGAPTWHPLSSESYGIEWALLDGYNPVTDS